MSATALKSGRPPWAVTAWVDDVNVYVELPTKEGPPYIASYPQTENGLGKALNVMREMHSAAKSIAGGKGGTYVFKPDHPMVKRKGPQVTEAERSAVAALLKKAGIT